MSNIKRFRFPIGAAIELLRSASDLKLPLQEMKERLPARSPCGGKLKERPHA